MKKLFVLFICLFALQTVVRADDDKPIQITQLPQKAQQFIKQHFSDSKIALAKMESKLFSKSYDVIFTSGNKIEFDKEGDWKEISCKYSEVPAALIPDAIKQEVASKYPETKILEIERDTNDYEVRISNGWELKFDFAFKLIDVDK